MTILVLNICSLIEFSPKWWFSSIRIKSDFKSGGGKPTNPGTEAKNNSTQLGIMPTIYYLVPKLFEIP